MGIIETERLILRTWRKEDAEAFFQIHQDPKVVEFLSEPSTKEQIEELIVKLNKHFEKHDFTLWAACLKETGELIGYIGLYYLKCKTNFTPAVEVACRLGSQYWCKGYATEGAKASLDYGFNKSGLKEIISFAVPDNIGAIRVMEKIGMTRDPNGDFVHPKLDLSHRTSKNVLYRRQYQSLTRNNLRNTII